MPSVSIRGTIGLGTFVLLLFLSACQGCGKQHSWRNTYNYQGNQPYDLAVLYELLRKSPEGLHLVQDSLQTLAEQAYGEQDNYIYAGRTMYLQDADLDELLRFVEVGNRAFIFVEHLPEELEYHIFGDDCFWQSNQNSTQPAADDFRYVDTISFVLGNTQLLSEPFRTWHVEDYEIKRRKWESFNPIAFCDPEYGIELLGYVYPSGRSNFIRQSYGAGHFYIHVNPILFTNYYLVDSARYQYAEAALSYAHPGTYYWDEASRSFRLPPRTSGGYNPDGSRKLLEENHAFSFVLDQPGLAFSWYTLLGGLLLFLLFRGKRRQRVIPVHYPRENSSLQYVDTLARLSQQKGNHYKLAMRELKLLRHYLLQRYQIRWPEGQAAPADLPERIGIEAGSWAAIEEQINYVKDRGYLDTKELTEFYRKINQIYHL